MKRLKKVYSLIPILFCLQFSFKYFFSNSYFRIFKTALLPNAMDSKAESSGMMCIGGFRMIAKVTKSVLRRSNCSYITINVAEKRKGRKRLGTTGKMIRKRDRARTGSSGQLNSVEDWGGDCVKGETSNWGFRGYP